MTRKKASRLHLYDKMILSSRRLTRAITNRFILLTIHREENTRETYGFGFLLLHYITTSSETTATTFLLWQKLRKTSSSININDTILLNIILTEKKKIIIH